MARLGILPKPCYANRADVAFCTDSAHGRGFFRTCTTTILSTTRPLASPVRNLASGSSFERNAIMPIGTVKFFNTDKGYGFIAPEDGGEDSFVHISAVQAAGMATLNKEQRVSYEVETGRNGKKSAVNLSAA